RGNRGASIRASPLRPAAQHPQRRVRIQRVSPGHDQVLLEDRVQRGQRDVQGVQVRLRRGVGRRQPASRMRSLRVVTAAAVVSLLSAACSGGGGGTAAPPPVAAKPSAPVAPTDRDALNRAVAQRGTIPVVVALDTSFVPEGYLSTKDAAKQRAQIRR